MLIKIVFVIMGLVFGSHVGAVAAWKQKRECRPSPIRELGPFYKPGTPFKKQICEYDSRMERGFAVATGTFTRTFFNGSYPLIVRGIVRSADDCSPVMNAEVEAYQAHQFGKYSDLNPNSEEGFCRGVVRTNDRGEFEFRTYMPGSYGVLAGLAGSFELPPFVDRHIHMLIWHPNHEVLPTQLLFRDDVLLNSGIRGFAHGYDGSGLLLQPTYDAELKAWVVDNVEFVFPESKERLFPSRAEAAYQYCSYSTGDMIVPAVCMPKVTRFVKPSWIYLGLPFALYVGGPLIVSAVVHYFLTNHVQQKGTRNLIRLSIIPVFVAILSMALNPPNEHCLTSVERTQGAKVVRLEDGRNVEYFQFGSQATSAQKLLLQHGTMREGGVFRQFDQYFKDANLNVIAPTIPGFGCSSQCTGRKLQDWPSDVENILLDAGWIRPKNRSATTNDTVIEETFMIAGYSFGGAHALAVCAAMPERISKALIVSPTMPPEWSDEIHLKHVPTIGRLGEFLQNHGENAVVQSVLKAISRIIGNKDILLPKMVREAMEKLKSDGHHKLADALAISWSRAISRSVGGIAENLAVRKREWGFPLSTWTLANNGTVLVIANPEDQIDPIEIATFIANKVGNGVLKTWESPYGHWHYWAHWLEQLEYLLHQQ